MAHRRDVEARLVQDRVAVDVVHADEQPHVLAPEVHRADVRAPPLLGDVADAVRDRGDAVGLEVHQPRPHARNGLSERPGRRVVERVAGDEEGARDDGVLDARIVLGERRDEERAAAAEVEEIFEDVVGERHRVGRDVEHRVQPLPAARRHVDHVDAQRVTLRVEDAELRHPSRAEGARHVRRRRNDVGVIQLRGERKGDESEKKRYENVPGSFHDETFPGTGTRRNGRAVWLIPEFPRGDSLYRCSSGTKSRRRGPVKTCRGRAIFWSESSSISCHCDSQPETRGIANSTGNMSTGNFRAW